MHFLTKGILSKQGTYIMATFGTGILHNYYTCGTRSLDNLLEKSGIRIHEP